MPLVIEVEIQVVPERALGCGAACGGNGLSPYQLSPASVLVSGPVRVRVCVRGFCFPLFCVVISVFCVTGGERTEQNRIE